MSLLHRLLFLPEQASTFAEKVDHLHYLVVLTTFLASAAVALTALLLYVRYRQRSVGQTTRPVHPPVLLEVIFVVAPLSLFLLWFWIGFRDFVSLNNPPADALDVYVMGKQWMWKFSYPEGPGSVDALRVPKGRPVRLLLTSRDVIHSFFVPEFRVKQDVLPGRYTQTWFTATKAGRYPVLCTEMCGVGHSQMRGEVVVMEPEAFDEWLQEQRRGLVARTDFSAAPGAQLPQASMATQGQRLAVELGCLSCHTTDGASHIGPTWLDLYRKKRKLTSGQELVADEAYLTRSMMNPAEELVEGFPPVMPSYRGRLDSAAAGALVEFIKTLRSDQARTKGGEP